MKSLIVFAMLLGILTSCKEEKKNEQRKYPDPFGHTLHGNIKLVEDSMFVVDGTGRLVPDSVHYGLGEWKDGYLSSYTDLDSSHKNKVFTTYAYHPNGQLQTIISDHNGKRTYRLKVQLDDSGAVNSAQSFDSSGKMDAYNIDLRENTAGQLVSGKLFAADSTLINTFTMEYTGKFMSRSVTYDSTGQQSSLYTAKFNKDGDLISDTTRNSGKDPASLKIRNFLYEDYDSSKNWRKKTELSEKGIPKKIIRRKITYFQ